ncbi:right-handed parallel beta-helix repeat-containing protein [Candidatus Bathyarchaeota archaeon]|nr:right-handed parallel beta-helix repeat-containing protein [Candidatus Bathyarchaeota archaeon]
MKISKVVFLVFLCLTAVCIVNTQQVKSQDTKIFYILGDGSVYSSTNDTVPIQQEGNVYTFTDDMFVTSFVVQCSSIIIDGAGFNFAGDGDRGIDVSYVNGVTIKNVNMMGGFYYGIYVLESSGTTITNNTITGNYEGISLYTSTQNTVSGNSITNNQIGIDLLSASDNVFRDNSLNNGYNFAVYGSDLSHFINDIDASNTVNGKKIYYLVNKNNLVISPDTYPDAGFVAIVGCTNITVRDLELSNNGQGILLAYTTSSTIGQNVITNNYNGILLFRSSSNVVSSNSIIDNYRGIQFSNSSNSNSITANNISGNTNGLFLFESSQNAISGNNITDNNTGIGFRASSSNRIMSNYFVNNEVQVYDYYLSNSSITPSLNFWSISYQIGGNYWSDYTGVDVKSGSSQNLTGSDNIGDTPYILYGANKDDFPLLPYGSTPAITIVSPENKTYSTTDDVTLEFTVSEATSWIKYSLDGQANVTITGSATLSGLAEGTHSITVYAQDTDGLTGMSEIIYFTLSEDTEPTQSESFPITWIAGAIVIVVGVALLIYMFKIKKK